MIQAENISVKVNDTDPGGPMLAVFTRTDTQEIVSVPVVLTLADAKSDADTVKSAVQSWLDSANGIDAINETLKDVVL